MSASHPVDSRSTSRGEASDGPASGAVLVTGATGNVGSELTRLLAERGIHTVAAVVPSQMEDPGGASGVECRPFSFTDPSTWRDALRDVRKVFLMRPPHISNIKRDMLPFMRRLVTAGIRHVVFLSVQGAEANRMVPHYKVEQFILELGLPYTFVRPAFFMQNLTTTHLPEIRDDHRIFVPAGTGRTNFIDVRDVAAVIAQALMDDAHIGHGYTVTGAESYTYYEVADRLSRTLETTIQYEPARVLPFIRYHMSQGRSLAHALVMVALYTVSRLGKAAGTTDTVQALLGRAPLSLDQFIADHRGVLTGDAP